MATRGSSAISPLAVRTFRAEEFSADRLLAAKGDTVVSVCLPARDEAATVGPIVAAIRRDLLETGVVDEILVVDDGSSDDTASVATDAGARVVPASAVLPELGPGSGKGEALWKSLAASEGDVIAWCDADLRDFDAAFVRGLLGPLLVHGAGFVKGFYDRPLDGQPGEGGRVTELVARPLVSLLFPKLASFVQPLAGEYAGRRSVLELVPFVQGYGVELALLVDLAATIGLPRMAQVDLGVRSHRNRPLDELSPQALAVLQAGLRRAGVAIPDGPVALERPGRGVVTVEHIERPPLATVPAYRRRAS